MGAGSTEQELMPSGGAEQAATELGKANGSASDNV